MIQFGSECLDWRSRDQHYTVLSVSDSEEDSEEWSALVPRVKRITAKAIVVKAWTEGSRKHTSGFLSSSLVFPRTQNSSQVQKSCYRGVNGPAHLVLLSLRQKTKTKKVPRGAPEQSGGRLHTATLQHKQTTDFKKHNHIHFLSALGKRTDSFF